MNKALTSILDAFSSSISIKSVLIYKLIFSFSILLLIWIIRQIIIAIVWKRTDEAKIRYRWKKTSGYFTIVIIILFLGIIWIEGFESITTIFAAISAVLVFILRDPVANLTGWLFIISRKQLEVGDRIQIDDTAGDVIDINIFYFTIMEIGNWVNADQSTGRIIHIPNSFILNKTLANYTKGLEFVWNEIPVTITFESDWKKAKNILTDIINKYEKNTSFRAEQRVKEAAKRFYINYSKFTPIVYTDVNDYGVCLTIRYLCEPRKRRQSEADIWENILDMFSKQLNIDFAYPTQRFYNHLNENKTVIDKKDFNK